jgi:hypothetical protein
MAHPHGKALISAEHPRAFATCARCGDWVNRYTLTRQHQWAGTVKVARNLLVCERCLDAPSAFLGTATLPPDPPPILRARVERSTSNRPSSVECSQTIYTVDDTYITVDEI